MSNSNWSDEVPLFLYSYTLTVPTLEVVDKKTVNCSPFNGEASTTLLLTCRVV